MDKSDATTGRPPEAFTIAIQSKTFTGRIISSPFQAQYSTANGRFEIHDVVPGYYTVIAQALHKQAGTDLPSLEASVPLTVSSNVDDLMIELFPPASIAGRIILDGQELSRLPGFERIRIRLQGAQSGRQSGPVNPDGTFRIDDVMPGQYQVVVCLGFQGNPAGCARNTPAFYLKYAQFDRSDVLNGPFQFTGGVHAPLDIVLSLKPGTIVGRVVNEKQLPVVGANVVLIPENLRQRFDLYKVALSDLGGNFSFRGVPPGAYKIFAWETLEENAFFDVDLIRQVEPYGKLIRISESDQVETVIKVIPTTH